MPYENIGLDTDGPLAIVTLNRPNRRNALSLELMLELIDCLARIGGDHNIRAVILAAAGKVFCSGHDLGQMVGRDINEYRRIFDVCTDLMTKVQSIPQPVIAQVQGIATAAGCQLVATCDLAVASSDARFAVSGINLGLFCSTPAVAISRSMLQKPALEMLLTGDFIDAPTARERGLVNRVVPREGLDAEVEELATQIASKSPEAVAAGKRLFYQQRDLTIEAAYAKASDVMAQNAILGDAQKGIARFSKRS